ncbi:MAG: FtsX-like permease family protein [Ardenticatenales bacterium]|nr:FtsX-like permease family protein [Ardenticatenales bacterium]
MEVPALGDRTLTLLGIDPLADAPFRDLLTGTAGDQASVVALSPTGGSQRGADPVVGPGMLLSRSDGVLLGRALADATGTDVGASLIIDTGGGPITATLIGILDASDALGRRALEGLVLADIGAAQAFLGRGGRLDRIDLRLPEAPAARDAALAALAALLPPSAVIEPAGAAADTVASMTDAFRLNLTALSLLALLVGMFLIFNTVRFNVVQRRPVLACLRALGVTRGQICALVLAEAAALGVVGAVLGVGLGLLMGRGAVALVSRTINDLYFAVDVQNVDASPASLVRALAGLAAALLAAALPALEAARVPPVTAPAARPPRKAPVAASGAAPWLRLPAPWAGAALLLLPSRSVALGFVALRPDRVRLRPARTGCNGRDDGRPAPRPRPRPRPAGPDGAARCRALPLAHGRGGRGADGGAVRQHRRRDHGRELPTDGSGLAGADTRRPTSSSRPPRPARAVAAGRCRPRSPSCSAPCRK